MQSDRTSMGGSYANDSVAAPTGGGVFPLSENLVIMAVCLHRCIGLATYISEVAEISVFDSMQDRSMEDELQPLHLALSLHSPNVVLVGENVGAEMKASLAEMTGDIMYFHQAMKQDDADEFRKAIVREINGHVRNEN